MKLEPDLALRLRAEADRLDVSSPPAASLVRRSRRHGRMQTLGKGLLVLAVIGSSAGTGLIVTKEDPPVQQATRGVRDQDREQAYENNPELFDSGIRPRTTVRNQGGTTSGGGVAASSGTTGSTSTSVVPGEATTPRGSLVVPPNAASPRVIKTARMRIEVGDGSLNEAFAEVERLAGRYRGFIHESSTSSFRGRSGRVTIRVPSPVFESAVAELKSLGRVESQSVEGVDVTADFVDLGSRLRNWEAQERVLLRLMSEANTINESLQVQRELQDVQLEIESIRGQLRVLRDQTDLATISMTLHEPGAAAGTDPKEKGAWERALAAAGEVLEAMLLGLGYLVPIFAALLVLWMLSRAIRSRRAV